MKVTSFMMGLGAGAAVAVLFAPRSGEKTRNLIVKKVQRGRRFAERRALDLRDMAGEAVDRGVDMARDMATDVVDRGLEVINRQAEAVTSAAQAAKETYDREAKAS